MTNPWRTIILDCHESLGICDNQMIIKRNEDKMAVPVEQIREILITSDKGSISLPLLVKLASQKTKVVKLRRPVFMPAVMQSLVQRP